ncbi:MAG: transcription antitermination factor NusB [Ignavibacteria bacterium]|nr:transcription antitermination factor NusB [Ignavibacteria bacterium]
MAREKILQVLAATAEGEISLDDVFPHVFFRQFTFDTDQPSDKDGRILRQDEVFELEADIPIEWATEDLEYAKRVLQKTAEMQERSRLLIDKHSKNWDLERIAMLDRILMNLAIAELVACADIPIKVTINEVIELAKRYSTDKSGVFINGILDAVIQELTEEGLITKSGRGLL